MDNQGHDDFDPFPYDTHNNTQSNCQVFSSYEEVSTPKSSRPVRQRVSNRGGNFSIDEDKNLVSAWLNTSMDAVQGTDQKSKTFWSRITTTYNDTRGPNHNERTERSLNSRWQSIQLAVNKFMGALTQVEAARPSGTNEIDKIQMAKEMYQQLYKSHFQFDHCWNMLRHQPKWTMQMGQPSSKRKQSGSQSTSTADAINLDDDHISISTSIDLERPIGRKAEKERRKKMKGDHIELSDVIGQLTINKKKEHDERMALAEIERNRAEKEWQDHLFIQNEKLQIEKVRAEADRQRAEADRQRAESEREKVEQQRMEREFQIMMTDLSTLNEVQRKYVESLQVEIISKRQQ